MPISANDSTDNDTEGVETPTDFVEYRIAKWLWLYVAPVVLIIGVTGKTVVSC